MKKLTFYSIKKIVAINLTVFSGLSVASPTNEYSSSTPFQVAGYTSSNDGRSPCAFSPTGTGTALNLVTTHSNRPVGNMYYPRYLAAKAVLVNRNLSNLQGLIKAL